MCILLCMLHNSCIKWIGFINASSYDTNPTNGSIRDSLRPSTLRRQFRSDELDYMWEKADKCDGFDPTYFRKDKCGNLICRKSYGQDELLGWHGDHSKPMKQGGTYHLNNLQALQSTQNKSKGEKYPYDYDNEPKKGISPEQYANIEAKEVDKRSSYYKKGIFIFFLFFLFYLIIV